MSIVDFGYTIDPSSSTREVSIMPNFDRKDSHIMNFKLIDGKVIDVSDDVMADLITDKIYIIETCLAIQQGYNASELSCSYPGKS